MSSYILSAKHFNSIEFNLRELIIYKSDFYMCSIILKLFPGLERNNNTETKKRTIQGVMDTLRELNVLCVSFQYKDHYQGKLDEEIQVQKSILISPEARTVTPKHLSNLGLYNALRCLNYQIEIEHLKDVCGLTEEQENAMKFLKLIMHDVCRFIVSKLPEDNTNTWSID